jgi:hypothetical protein
MPRSERGIQVDASQIVDLAASTHRVPSYTSGALVGCDYDTNQVYIADIVTPADVTQSGVLSILAATGPEIPILIEEEKGSSGKLLLEQIARQLPGHRIVLGKLTGDRVFGLLGEDERNIDAPREISDLPKGG